MARTQVQRNVAATVPRFAVGDHVVFKLGPTSLMPAEILEDRGLIGHARRQYYRIRTIDTEPSEPISFDAREEDLLPKSAPAVANPARRSSVR